VTGDKQEVTPLAVFCYGLPPPALLWSFIFSVVSVALWWKDVDSCRPPELRGLGVLFDCAHGGAWRENILLPAPGERRF
jgi:hypothetical protein